MKPTPQILLTSLAGDALCLGPHWIYDQREIAQKLGQITGYAAPLTSYHPGKQAGDFTHYGDQTLILLRSLRGGLAGFLGRSRDPQLPRWSHQGHLGKLEKRSAPGGGRLGFP
jgi:hypothetical protein